MVLHNSKWDRRATRKYHAKHGGRSAPASAALRPAHDVSEDDSTSDDSSDLIKSSTTEPTASDTPTIDTPPATVDTVSSSSASVVPALASSTASTPRRNTKNLPSNAWRYADPATPDDPNDPVARELAALQIAQEDAYLRSITRPDDGGLSKYLASDKRAAEQQQGVVDAVAEIFESQIEHVGGGAAWMGKRKGRKVVEAAIAPQTTIRTYTADDPEFRDSDRRIERLKYADSVRDIYKSATRREQEQDMERLKRLPKQIAMQVMRDRRGAAKVAPVSDQTKSMKGRDIDNEFDQFWNELEARKTTTGDIMTKTPVGQATPKATAAFKPWGVAKSASVSRPNGDDEFVDSLIDI
ncbi:uncharacterized protein V1518DRAFT_417062 [Limtongia smithiae]|uniref:uncharacterized protein n=1 Tax=Limtongia smithiae TaxID=1125753 RepID=UPI0034CD2D26